ncbi:MAG: hypothetical protein PF551_01950 [Candidatus Marinimicrobia bacterium]|jgi:Spy/CpxP family protein refolding chaperone|nr:hypothetical protein [Candidatus Neomarinimicrobiota bacterium]
MKKILLISFLMINIIFAQENCRMNPAVENYRVYQMTNNLKLTTEQSEQFFPMLRSHVMKMQNIEQKILELYKKVNNDNSIDKAEYRKIKDKLMGLENKKVSEKSQFVTDLESVLEPEQIAKYMFFDRKFRRDLRQHLKHRRR